MTDHPGGSSEPLLSVRNLHTHYPITEGLLRREGQWSRLGRPRKDIVA